MKKIIFPLLFIGLGIVGFFNYEKIFSGTKDDLVITLNTDVTDLSPYGLDLNNATRTANIYQGLVAFDENLRIVPALAVSWGNISDTVWEFRLRQGVSFHDGSFFTAQDVIRAWERAKSSNNSNVLPYLNSIKEMKIVEGNKIQIITSQPDPLLLSKLTKIYIYQGENMGTGPYRIKEWIPADRVELTRHEGYWGIKPNYSTLIYQVLISRVDREASFQKKETDILVAVSPDHALKLPAEQVKKMYGLEVNFLMFKLDDPVFSDKRIREAIQRLIDPKKIEAIGNQFVTAASQFIPPGVFGFNSLIKAPLYELKNEPRDLFGIKLERLNFHYLESYQTLSEYLAGQLQKAGFSVKNLPQSPEELLKKVRANEAQFYLLGWQFEDGDAGSFFDAFIHSEGVFNKGRYKNDEIDQLIEKSRREMVTQKRLELLREIGMKLKDDLVGIPLFESSRLYAIQPEVQWKPRLDGLILGADVKN